MNAVQIAHDGFARATLYRERCESGRTCADCGQPARWRYQYESDASTKTPLQWRPFGYTADQAFCSIACFRSYYP